MVFLYVALWPLISSGCGGKSEDSCSRLLLGSCDLRVSSCLLWAAGDVLPVLSGLSTLLGDQVPPFTTWIWCTVAEDGPEPETETGRPNVRFLKIRVLRKDSKNWFLAPPCPCMNVHINTQTQKQLHWCWSWTFSCLLWNQEDWFYSNPAYPFLDITCISSLPLPLVCCTYRSQKRAQGPPVTWITDDCEQDIVSAK